MRPYTDPEELEERAKRAAGHRRRAIHDRAERAKLEQRRQFLREQAAQLLEQDAREARARAGAMTRTEEALAVAVIVLPDLADMFAWAALFALEEV